VLRWSGSEQGVAVPECWSTAHFQYEEFRNNVTCDSPGDPEDPLWAPVEADIPSRDVLYAHMGGWMYHEDDADKTYSGENLFARYLTSVGRNANLLIGSVPDPRGLISEDQVQALSELGELVSKNLGTPLSETDKMTGDTMELRYKKPVDLQFIEILEDQSNGQHVHDWVLALLWPDDWNAREPQEVWIPVTEGKSIGHKRILQLNQLRARGIRVRVRQARDGYALRSFKAYGQKVYD